MDKKLNEGLQDFFLQLSFFLSDVKYNYKRQNLGIGMVEYFRIRVDKLVGIEDTNNVDNRKTAG